MEKPGTNDTRRPEPGTAALLYRLEAGTEKGDGIRRILNEMAIEIIDLTDVMLDQPVGVCAGLDAPGSQPGSPHGAAAGGTAPGDGTPADDVLIMCGFSDERINQLLTSLRAARLPRVALMATLTEHNRSWSLRSLIGELARERAGITAWMSLQQAVKIADTALADYPDLNTPALARALADGRAILDSREPPENVDAIIQADQALRAFMPGLPAYQG